MTSPKRLIRVGHSPDPDDAFMFYALACGQIDTGQFEFAHELADIETLNRRAAAGELELTAVSVHAYAFLTERYALCTCGASIGDGYGPIVVARDGLTVLSGPVVERQHPAEGAALTCLTILVEELSSELQQPGASMNDLMDTLKFIKQLPAESSTDLQNMKAWVPYLETKTGNAPSA